MFWRRKQSDFSAEIEAHLSHEVDRLRRELGLSDEEARAVARREFGNLAAAEEKFYEAGRWMWWDHLRNDIRYALRLMAKDVRLTAIVVVTLALGIAANSIIFSAVRAVLLRPLPYRQPDRLVQVWDSGPRSGGESDWVSFPDFRDWRAANRVFEEIAAWRFATLTLVGWREPEAMVGLEVTDRLFAVLGVKPALGRTFLPAEDSPGRETVAVISHGLWHRRFGSDPGVAGSRVNIAGKPYTIIGVMPPQFRFPNNIPGDNDVVPIDLWIPMRTVPDLEERGSHNFTVARLKKGVTLSQSRANMDAVAANLALQYPDTNKDMGATVLRLQDHLTSDVAPVLAILLAAVGLVLLLVCANVAGLLLSRAQARARELAIRASLGAGRGRLIRQVLTESMLLAAFGAMAGLMVARFGASLLVKFGPANIPRLGEAAIDGQVALFTAAAALVAGLLCGVGPALLAGGPDLHRSLKEAGARATASRRSFRARNVLVATEMALAVVLLTGAGLLIRSFVRVIPVDPGFRATNVLSVIIGLPDSRYSDPAKQTAFFEELVRRLHATSGHRSGRRFRDSVPLTGSNDQGGFRIEGRPEPKPGDDGPQANRPRVSSKYFGTMGIPLLRGRLFDERDGAGSVDVAVISDLAARIYWPGEDPIGKRVCVDWAADGRPDPWRQIVGIVRKYAALWSRGAPKSGDLPSAHAVATAVHVSVGTVQGRGVIRRGGCRPP